jgi:hypothetical protein
MKRKFATVVEQAHTYIGRRCLRGHSGLRYRSTRACVHCQKDFSLMQREAKKALLYLEADVDA